MGALLGMMGGGGGGGGGFSGSSEATSSVGPITVGGLTMAPTNSQNMMMGAVLVIGVLGALYLIKKG